jgi:uncharacterized protein
VVDVVEVPEKSRFEARSSADEDGPGSAGGIGAQVLGFAEYHRDGRTVVFTHTVVRPENEGQGVGSTLVRGALDAVRARGDDVLALCPFVKAWVDRHPDYQDLLAGGARDSSDE